MGITSPLSDSIMEVMGLLLWIDHCLTPNVISGPPTQADEAQLMCQQFFFFLSNHSGLSLSDLATAPAIPILDPQEGQQSRIQSGM